jgi:hypothetical protein
VLDTETVLPTCEFASFSSGDPMEAKINLLVKLSNAGTLLWLDTLTFLILELSISSKSILQD